MWQTERRAGDNRRSPELRESYFTYYQIPQHRALSTTLLHQSEKQINNIDYFSSLLNLINDWMLCTIYLVGWLSSFNI